MVALSPRGVAIAALASAFWLAIAARAEGLDPAAWRRLLSLPTEPARLEAIDANVVNKPYRPSALARAIRQAIDTGPEDGTRE